MDKAHARRFELLGLAVLLTLWGWTGILTEPAGYLGDIYAPDYTLPSVAPGSALAEAGFRTGDRVVAVEGIAVEKLGMYSRWPRSLARSPGETLQIAARRAGTLVEGTVVVPERPRSLEVGRWVKVLLTQAFLWLGIWVLFTTPTAHAGRLALVGLVAGFAAPGPNLGSLNGVRDHLEIAGEVLFFILLLHFFLLFPRARAPARSRWIGAIYLPWVALLAAQVAELATHPRFYGPFSAYLGILFLGYLLAAGLAVVHTGQTLPREEYASSGMGFVLAGWGAAVFPNLAAAALRVVQPGWEIPGAHGFPFLLLAIPVGMALGVRRHARGIAGAPVP